jgi:hypothetical protein
MTRALTDFMATLHKNGVEEKKLSKYVTHRINNDFVTLSVAFPDDGQVGIPRSIDIRPSSCRG